MELLPQSAFPRQITAINLSIAPFSQFIVTPPNPNIISSSIFSFFSFKFNVYMQPFGL